VAADSHLVEFVEHFNRQSYFEAHDVLEEFWLITRGERRDFYKGLIQTAVALLKLQQGKTAPAATLARRAVSHLGKYGPVCEGMDVDLILGWLQDVIRGRNIVVEGIPLQLEISTR
jgi:predicted metal-dependent hydrolase